MSSFPLAKQILIAVVWLALASSTCIADPAIRIFLAGDSTIAEKLPENRPETGWGEALQTWFPEDHVVVRNLARNGRSTRTFLEEGLWENLLAEVQPGDYVFIQFGHNDQSVEKVDRYTSPEQFTANLRRFIEDVEAREAIPVLITPVVRRRFDENGNFYDSHGEYPDLVRALASETATTLVDLNASSAWYLAHLGAERSADLFMVLPPQVYINYPDGLDDNTHFSPLGATTMASLVVDAILDSGLELAAMVAREPHMYQQESEIGKAQPGPHQGGGETTGYTFFADQENLNLVFKKRALHPGAAIGYHLHDKDEIYYVISGMGEMTMNGVVSIVTPGTAILTRPGDSHGLRQIGDEDLVIFINYENNP